MRRVEAGSQAALAQGRYNSVDVAARVHSRLQLMEGSGAAAPMTGTGRRRAASQPSAPWQLLTDGAANAVAGGARQLGADAGVWVDGGKAGRVWRPSPVEFSRGTHDTRLGKAARVIIRGLDLEQYQG